MIMLLHWLLLLIAFLATAVQWAVADFPLNDADLKARLDLSAFKFFSKTAHHVVDLEIPKITIPDITLDITAGPGSGKVSAHDLNITKFKSPNFNFLLSEEGLSWSSNGGAVKIGGLWEAEYTLAVPFRESGWIQVLAADIQVNVSARVLDVQARPQIVLGNCTADID
ncbi:hypothetical protein COOONC_02671 [Cooperia oncophora]